MCGCVILPTGMTGAITLNWAYLHQSSSAANKAMQLGVGHWCANVGGRESRLPTPNRGRESWYR